MAPIISSSEQLRKPQELGCRTSKWRSRDKSSVCLASRQRPELLHRSVGVSGPPVSVQSAPSQRVAFTKAAHSPRSEPGRPPPRVCYGLPGGRSGDQFQSATEEHKLSPAPSEDGRLPVGCPPPPRPPCLWKRSRQKTPTAGRGVEGWELGHLAVLEGGSRGCHPSPGQALLLSHQPVLRPARGRGRAPPPCRPHRRPCLVAEAPLAFPSVPESSGHLCARYCFYLIFPNHDDPAQRRSVPRYESVWIRVPLRKKGGSIYLAEETDLRLPLLGLLVLVENRLEKQKAKPQHRMLTIVLLDERR